MLNGSTTQTVSTSLQLLRVLLDADAFGDTDIAGTVTALRQGARRRHVYDTDSIGLLTHLGVGLEVDLRYDPDSIGIVTGSRCGVRC